MQRINYIEKTLNIVEGMLRFLCGAYVFAILAIMPLYFTDGYAKIGTNKYEFYESVAGLGAIALIVLLTFWSVLRVLLRKGWKFRFTWLDVAVACYGLCVVISYIFSAYKGQTPYGDVWNGANGWYMGAKTQLMFVGSYFVISRGLPRGKVGKAISLSFLPSGFVAFLLGYLNRFEVRPLQMKAANPSFISTIGNMNWYCGYLVIVLFSVVGYVWATKKISKLFLVPYLLVGFGTLVTQGSVSGLVVLSVVFFLLFLMALSDVRDMRTFAALVMLLGLATTVTYAIRMAFPEAMSFMDALFDLFTGSMFAVFILAIGGALYLGTRRQDRNLTWMPLLAKVLGGTAILCFVMYLALLITNTLHPGIIGPLSDNPLFTFDSDYGSNRGATWMAAWGVFSEQSVLHKLFGVGPDGMAMYLYTDGSLELLAMVKETFGKSTLTNAHCELLNVMVNLGVIGALVYTSVFVCVGMILYRELKEKETADAVTVALCFGVMAYMINNLFSFQQAMNGATIYVVLGLLGAKLQER